MPILPILFLLPVANTSGSYVSITLSEMFNLALLTILVLFVLLVAEYLSKILSKTSSIVK